MIETLISYIKSKNITIYCNIEGKKIKCLYDEKTSEVLCTELLPSGVKKVINKDCTFRELLKRSDLRVELNEYFLVFVESANFLKIYPSVNGKNFVPFNWTDKEELKELLENIDIYVKAYKQGFKDSNRRGRKWLKY